MHVTLGGLTDEKAEVADSEKMRRNLWKLGVDSRPVHLKTPSTRWSTDPEGLHARRLYQNTKKKLCRGTKPSAERTSW